MSDTTATRQRVSLKKENFAAGGVLPEGDYMVMESSFTIFQYTYKSGATGATTTAYRLVMVPVAKKGNKWEPVDGMETQDQHYSVGDPTAIVPSVDGNYLEAIGTRTTLGSGSNYYLAYDSLLNAGLPEELWETHGAKLLVGMIGHIVHIPEPDRSSLRERSAVATGVADQQPQKRRDQPRTIPVFKTIHVAPWDKNKKGAAAPAPAKEAASPKVNGALTPAMEPVAVPTSDAGRLAKFIKDVVVNGGGNMKRVNARLQVHRAYNLAKIDGSTRDAELAAFNDEAALGDILASVNCIVNGDTIEYVSE